ncbi:protein kinase [Scytonema sp. UIC 10036]|uniref:protein kinase domain-containing protein n=1 Tax=Scytonema sp. UIC 10036 TaxID=2304196 RepID=UPI0012DA1A33|nr:protein kinase [Scytonema sp. UIC 10036]
MDLIKKFQREASILAELSHQQIPRAWAFFGIEIEDQTGILQRFFYLVQDYIEGHNLSQELRRKGKFPEDEVVKVLKEILKILHYIHNYNDTQGAIHRDIKPSNIMRRSKDGLLFLIDFGAVKQVLHTGLPADESSRVLTPDFAPPEQFEGARVSPASDLYALATTCVCLLTGRNPRELLSNSSWREHVNVRDQSFGKALDWMLKYDQQRRPQSAQQVLDFLSSEQQTPLHDQFHLWLREFKRIFRRWRWIILAGLALLVIAIAIIIHLSRPQPIVQPPPTTEPSPSSVTLTADYFSRGENAVIADGQEFSKIPKCQIAYDFKKQGMSAFAKANSPETFKTAEIAFQKAIEQFIKVDVQNKCEVDPETWIYYYNSKAAQTTSGSTVPTIAVVVPSNSEYRGIAQEILRGVAQAQKDVPGLQVLIAKENSNKIEEVQQVARIISENQIPDELPYFKGNKVLGVIGGFTSTNTWEAGKIYGDKTLVLISSTSTAIRQPNPYSKRPKLNSYVFRTASNDSIAAGDLAKYMWDVLKKRKVLIAFESNNTYSESLRGEFRQKLINEGANDRDILVCDLTNDSSKTCINIARNAGVEVLMLAPSPTTLKPALEIAQHNALPENSKLQLLAGDVLYDKKTLNLGDAVNNMVIAVPSHVSLGNSSFIEKTREHWGTQNVSWRTLTSYDATQVFIAVLTELRDQGKNNPSSQDIYEKLREPSFSVPSATAVKVEFDPEHDRKIVKGIGVLVQAKNSPTTNPSANNTSRDEYGFTLLLTPNRDN